MTIDFDKPVLTTLFSDVLTFIRDNIINVATWFADRSGANIPDGAKSWNATNRRFEKYNSTTPGWETLLDKTDSDNPYEIRAAVSNSCEGNASEADYAANAGKLGGDLAEAFTKKTDVRLVEFGGTGGSTQEEACNNLGVYSKTETIAEIGNKLAIVAYASTTETAYKNTTTTITAPTGYTFLFIPYQGFIHTFSIASDGKSVSIDNSAVSADLDIRFIWFKMG